MRALALCLLAATLAAQTPGRGVNFYSYEKEKALGAQIAADYRAHTPILDSPAVNAYLNELGQRLAAQAPATVFTYTFELADDERTWLHEPASFPGGPVFVPARLVRAAAGEDELAAMLAHAIAHIVTRQQTRELTRGQVINYATIPLIYMGGVSGYATANSAAVPTGFLAFQRKNELEADRVAVGILAAAGYDPQALARYIDRIQPADPPLRNATAPYPEKDQRLAALAVAIQQLPLAQYSEHPGLAAIQQEVSALLPPPSAKNPPRLAR